MAEHPVVEVEAANLPPARSTIKFPYGDIEDALKVAEAIHTNYGLGCELEQLAAQLSSTTTSSSFRTKLSTAKTFGVIAGRRKRAELTDLGRQIVDPTHTASARVTSFLGVPLYKALYEEFSGGLLPGDSGIEAEMIKLGVTRNSVDRARQAFQRSADAAGFFAQGRNRLVKPAAGNGAVPEDEHVESQGMADSAGASPTGGEFRNDPRLELHPLLDGIWATLPPVDGSFSKSQRERWLQMAQLALEMVYGGEEESRTRSPNNERSDSGHADRS